jgi:hypothetical protein
MIKLTDEDIHVLNWNTEGFTVEFRSLEGYPIQWSLEEAKELKQQILQNQKLREKIVDIADLWDGNESSYYGQRLQVVLKDLGINDTPNYELDADVVEEILKKTKEEKSSNG